MITEAFSAAVSLDPCANAQQAAWVSLPTAHRRRGRVRPLVMPVQQLFAQGPDLLPAGRNACDDGAWSDVVAPHRATCTGRISANRV